MDSIDRSILEANGPNDVKEPENINRIIDCFNRANHGNGPDDCDLCEKLKGHAYLSFRVGIGMPHYIAILAARKILIEMQERVLPKNISEMIEKSTDVDQFDFISPSGLN